MRIVIDMQGAQTESRFRGIGRYTMAFTKGVARNCGEHEIILALNGLFPETIELIRAEFDDLLPQENIRVWEVPGPVSEVQSGNDARREAAELIREAFLASLEPDVIHINSLFEGYVDDAVTSIGRFDRTTPVSVTLHDLIPLLNPDQYLKPNPRHEQYYLRKIDSIKNARCYLAISESSKEEGEKLLSASDASFVNTKEAVEDFFCHQAISSGNDSQLRAKFGITHPFVLYTGGADERKNLPRLIKAYAALPRKLREGYHLVFAGKMPEGDILRLKDIAQSAGLKGEELLLTGYVSDQELVQLYNLCQLYVFPSWHEGFGLPALEAMACGAPVIGANTSSLPEVIGLEEALFDPFDVEAISAKLMQALEDESFNKRLRHHGLYQAKKFSWDETAKRAIAAWEELQLCSSKVDYRLPPGIKPKLAFVSPLPPERTGIADYSAELLPALSDHYDIEVIVAQDRVEDPWVKKYAKIRDVSWLRANAANIDRVLYQMGNSPFHQHMLSLMAEIPGTVVLHDFYLSGLLAWMELHGGEDHVWTKSLYDSHGYAAVRDRYQNAESAKMQYPVNAYILQHAHGIIFHSEYSRRLVQHWYGSEWRCHSAVIPLLRAPSQEDDKLAARKRLGIAQEDFLVCSFGFLDSTKLNHRLLQSWLNSSLAKDKRCHLVFVGENHGGDYGAELLKTIRSSGCKEHIRITGYASPDLFKNYLASADVAVQLRAQSRGETSAAVLDCMNYGLPTIVNANGSMDELDARAIWRIPNEFEDRELINSLEKLWRSAEQRRNFSKRARECILSHHAPESCARQYSAAIESFYARNAKGLSALIQALADELNVKFSENEVVQLAVSLGRTLPLQRMKKHIYLDVTDTFRDDLKTGIDRVARALSLALLESPPKGYRVEPVYLSYENGRWLYRYARRYTLSLLECPEGGFEDDIVEPDTGDVLLGLDLSGDQLIQAEQSGLFRDLRNRGIKVLATVFDLLPVRIPEVFPPDAARGHYTWLQAISSFDGAVCISQAVADDLSAWQNEAGIEMISRRPYSIDWFHLGADIDKSAPTTGVPLEAGEIMKNLSSRASFLMVGTIEPRKGYLEVLDVFDRLWNEGVDANLVIVGREGWSSLPNEMRRDIPQTINRLRTHPERQKRLVWLEGISDEYLEQVYAASTCLIAASYGEGFGLPLIEAAQHRLPIIARNISVFREVAGDHAYYFDSEDPNDLAGAIKSWLELYKKGNHPTSDKMPWLTWKESAAQLLNLLIDDSEHAATLDVEMGSKRERNLRHQT